MRAPPSQPRIAANARSAFPTARSIPAIVVIAMLALTLSSTATCSRSGSELANGAHAATPGPRDALQELIKLRELHQYDRMQALIVPQHANAAVETLMAVDEFLAANQRLCAWLRDNVGIGLAQSIDQSYLGDDLGFYLCNSMNLFARDVEFLDDTISGDQAHIAFIAGGRMPAEHVLLRRIAGKWVYDPGRPLPGGFADAFRDMARGLDNLVTDLESGRIPLQEVRDNRDWLMDKVEARLRRGVRLLSKARDEAVGE